MWLLLHTPASSLLVPYADYSRGPVWPIQEISMSANDKFSVRVSLPVVTNFQPSGEASSSSHFCWCGMDPLYQRSCCSRWLFRLKEGESGPIRQGGYEKIPLYCSAVIVIKPYSLEWGMAGLMLWSRYWGAWEAASAKEEWKTPVTSAKCKNMGKAACFISCFLFFPFFFLIALDLSTPFLCIWWVISLQMLSWQ